MWICDLLQDCMTYPDKWEYGYDNLWYKDAFVSKHAVIKIFYDSIYVLNTGKTYPIPEYYRPAVSHLFGKAMAKKEQEEKRKERYYLREELNKHMKGC